MEYEQIIASLPKVMKYNDTGSRIPLLQKILRTAGQPDNSFKTIHICGTNGKGSTALMISKTLQLAGFKVGAFSSPAMYDERKQIQIDQELISRDDFVECYAKLVEALEKLQLQQADISVFETWYLVSAIYFAQKGVDYAVYECGMGGELDATNATSNVEYSVFTRIALDHQKFLGSTIEEIATTKSKIIRPGTKVFSYPQQEKRAEQILQQEADSKESTLYRTSDTNVALEDEQLDHSIVSLYFRGEKLEDVDFNLGGLYQIQNLQNVLNFISIFNQDHHKIIKLAHVLDMM